MDKAISFFEVGDRAEASFEVPLGKRVGLVVPGNPAKSQYLSDEQLIEAARKVLDPRGTVQEVGYEKIGDALLNDVPSERLDALGPLVAVIYDNGQERRYQRDDSDMGWVQLAEVVKVEETTREDARPSWFEAYRDFADQITVDLHEGRFGDPKTPLARASKTMLWNVSKVSRSGEWSETDRQSLAVAAYDVARRAAREAGGEDGDHYAGFASEVLSETMKNQPSPGAVWGFLRTDAELDAGRGFYNQLSARLTNEYRLPQATAHFTGDDRQRLKDLVTGHSFGIVKGSAIYVKLEEAMGPIDIRRKDIPAKAIESHSKAPKRNRQAAEMEI